MPANPRIVPCGDSALLVEFGDTISMALNAQVLALDKLLASAAIEGLTETVPTYRSLLVHYDVTRTGFAAMQSQLRPLLSGLVQQAAAPRRRWRVPVVYGEGFGEDLAASAERLGLSTDALIARHSGGDYQVAMLGFTPGFCYLAGLDPAIALPRRDNPRQHTPAGTISIGGAQAAIQCLASPSGWHLLGRTPVRTFLPNRDPVFLIEPGDRVQFYRIDPADWDRLDQAASGGEPVAELASA